MSRRNSRPAKRRRSVIKAERVAVSSGRIHHAGVIVSVKDVKRHRYLQAHQLPHSRTVADVHIASSERRGRALDRETELAVIATSALRKLRKKRMAA
jgi:hypothetical protein